VAGRRKGAGGERGLDRPEKKVEGGLRGEG
jgi:hypothetical protein